MMLPKKEFKNAHEILDFTIQMEEMSIEFYTNLAIKTRHAGLQPLYFELANQEKIHMEKLMNIDTETFLFEIEEKVSDFSFSDYRNPKLRFNSLSHDELLIIAMNREKRSSMLYEKLALIISDPKLKQVFRYLANEEREHRDKFEMEYSEKIVKYN